MIITVLDWVGTLFVFIGAFLITSKHTKKPKVRMLALLAYLIANGFWIPMAMLLETWGLLMSQLFLFIMNLKGIRNCLKEMKKEVKKNEEYIISNINILNDYCEDIMYDCWEDILYDEEDDDNEY